MSSLDLIVAVLLVLVAAGPRRARPPRRPAPGARVARRQEPSRSGRMDPRPTTRTL